MAQLLKSPEMLGIVTKLGEGIAARAGEGFEVKTMVGRSRARATVGAATPAARRRQARDHLLEKAVGGG